MQATNLDTIYGSPLLDWVDIKARLDEGLSQRPETGGPNRHTCWLATINRDGAPSAGPPPWFVYRLTRHSATAPGAIDPGGATRWRF